MQVLGIPEDDGIKKTLKRKRNPVTFNDEEEIINPEDVDPAVGRFRNLVQTTTIPTAKVLISVLVFMVEIIRVNLIT